MSGPSGAAGWRSGPGRDHSNSVTPLPSEHEEAATTALFISGSLGLGHAGRDLAIARELRELLPDIHIDWLAGPPASDQLEEAGERLLSESRVLGETAIAEEAAGAFSLNIVSYATRAAVAWARVATTVLRLVGTGRYGLVVGDETYELAVAFALRRSLKTVPWVVIYDFFGLDAMSRNPFERLSVYILNRLWGGGPHGKRPPFDLTLFVGEAEDIADRPLGPRLPNRRAYARQYFDFLGYILAFDPDALLAERASVRRRLGYDERPLIICSVGGTAVGADLLARCGQAFPHITEQVPDARMVLVCGPRIDPARIEAPTGVEVRGYVPRLYEHFAACDAAVVQAGGTTTLELTALRRPFIYVPLEGHAEQNLTVAQRLARHHAGQRRELAGLSANRLGDDIVRLLSAASDWPAIPTDGQRRAAELITALLSPATAA